MSKDFTDYGWTAACSVIIGDSLTLIVTSREQTTGK
jgi:hypothetical protein